MRAEDNAIWKWVTARKNQGQKVLQWRNAEAMSICPGRTALSMRDRYKSLTKKYRGLEEAVCSLVLPSSPLHRKKSVMRLTHRSF